MKPEREAGTIRQTYAYEAFRESYNDSYVDPKDAFDAGYRAGAEAQRERDAKICEKAFDECTARPNCHNLDADYIRRSAPEPFDWKAFAEKHKDEPVKPCEAGPTSPEGFQK